MSERIRMHAYICFTFLNIINCSIIEHWIWSPYGWLKALGVVDISGSAAVHLCGGAGALVAGLVIGPRRGRWSKEWAAQYPGSPFYLLFGVLLLW